MVQKRKPNSEKVIRKIFSLILDKRAFTQRLVLLDSKLNIPSRVKEVPLGNPTLQSIIFGKRGFNLLNQLERKDLC